MKNISTMRRLSQISKLCAAAVLALGTFTIVDAAPAEAGNRFQKVNNTFANGARAFSRSRIGNRNPVVRGLKGNIRIYDRLGWEAGRYMSLRKYGPAGDPGRYPGFNRR